MMLLLQLGSVALLFCLASGATNFRESFDGAYSPLGADLIRAYPCSSRAAPLSDGRHQLHHQRIPHAHQSVRKDWLPGGWVPPGGTLPDQALRHLRRTHWLPKPQAQL